MFSSKPLSAATNEQPPISPETERKTRPSISKLLEIFISNLNADGFSIKKSDEGGTGFTYVCVIPYESIESSIDIDSQIPSRYLTMSSEKTPLKLKIILKWCKKDLAENEKKCSDLLKIFKYSTPEIVMVNEEGIKEKVASLSSKITPSFMYDKSNDSLMFMYGFPGANFFSFLNNYRLQDLDKDSIHKLFFQFGEVVVADLLIGNDDRFFRFPTEDSPESNNFSINSGNIMVFAPFQDGKRVLKEVNLIDSTTSLLLRVKKSDENLSYLNGVHNLFDSSSVSTEEHSIDISTTESEDLKKSLNHFLKLQQKYLDPDNAKILIELIAKSIASEMRKSKLNGDVDNSFIDSMTQSLYNGFTHKILEIKESEYNLGAYEELDPNTTTHFSLTLLRSGLDIIKKIKYRKEFKLPSSQTKQWELICELSKLKQKTSNPKINKFLDHLLDAIDSTNSDEISLMNSKLKVFLEEHPEAIEIQKVLEKYTFY